MGTSRRKGAMEDRMLYSSRANPKVFSMSKRPRTLVVGVRGVVSMEFERKVSSAAI